MVTLSPRDAVREAGDWFIWMAHLEPSIGERNKTEQKIYNALSKSQFLEIFWQARHHWKHWYKDCCSPYLISRAAAVPAEEQKPSCLCYVLTRTDCCTNYNQSIKKASELWAVLWLYANQQVLDDVGTGYSFRTFSTQDCLCSSLRTQCFRPDQDTVGFLATISLQDLEDKLALLS